jgi:hypothetical protein
MALKVEISAGEFLDKLTILKIKTERITDAGQLRNINYELDVLRQAWVDSPLSQKDVSVDLKDLKAVNEQLWDIEDQLRAMEAQKEFGDEFVQLARSVYKLNDKRAAIKRRLNEIFGSKMVEEKSYTDYESPDD